MKDEELERVEQLAREAERERKQAAEEAALISENPDKPDEGELKSNPKTTMLKNVFLLKSKAKTIVIFKHLLDDCMLFKHCRLSVCFIES